MKFSTRGISGLGLAFAVLAVVGCAGAKIKDERVALAKGTISKSDLLLVKVINANNAIFTGDKSGDTGRVTEEKQIIQQLLSDEIIKELRKKGFNVQRYADGKGKPAVVLDGVVTMFEHGSGAARMFVGMGAGSSNMHVTIKLAKATNATLADFDVIATSGGRGGLSAMSSFLQAHISDAAEKTAEYIAKRAN